VADVENDLLVRGLLYLMHGESGSVAAGVTAVLLRACLMPIGPSHAVRLSLGAVSEMLAIATTQTGRRKHNETANVEI
jgi:hypothetical protein